MDSDSQAVLRVDRRELEALSELKVTIAEQQRLDDLLAKSKQSTATAEEVEELDRLLDRVDRLNLLKSKAACALKDSADRS